MGRRGSSGLRALVAAAIPTAVIATACADGQPDAGLSTSPSPPPHRSGRFPATLTEDAYISPEEAEELKEVFGLPEYASQLEVIEALTDDLRASRVANEGERYALRHAPKELGAVYLRHVGPIWFVRIGFTDRVQHHERALRAYVTYPELLSVYRAPQPRWKLRELARQISIGSWRSVGIPITSVGVDEAAGVVEIGVQDPTDEQRATLEGTYGPNLVRVIDEGPIVLLVDQVEATASSNATSVLG